MPQKFEIKQDDAHALALQALAFLAADEERLGVFLQITGIDADYLKNNASNPALLGGLMDYVLQNEGLLIEFAGSVGVKPEAVVRARHQLPGAEYDT